LKRVSTGVLAVLMVAGLGLNAVAALADPASHGNIGPNAIAQATPAPTPSPAATPMASPAPAATAMPAPAATTAPPPPMNFGSPPSGQIPILYNDHHVYARPDKLKQGRVLAALVRGGTILIPLRSMFEQMGATVSWDPASRTADVSKPGADVKVTVGRPQVIINGETRPLDVPPEIYQGVVVVPVRVISEGMGAYVQWVPDRRLVVVRYIPATPPPPPAPPPAPVPTPTPTPVAGPYWDHFIAGDYIISPKVYNEFSPGNSGSNSNGGFSYRVHGAIEFPLFNLPWMLEGDYRQYNYPHNQGVPTTPENTPFTAPGQGEICDGLNGHASSGDPGCVTAIGGQFQTFVPAFVARDYMMQVRLGLRVLEPRIYIGVGYLWRSGNYGYPRMSNVGFGIEKLPDLDQGFTVYGSAYYYPNVNGSGMYCITLPTDATIANHGCGNPVNANVAYNIFSYDIGVAFTFGPQVPVFVELGYLGERGDAKTNAPISFTENGPYAGIGLRF